MGTEGKDINDEEALELWNTLVGSAVRTGVAELRGDVAIGSKEFMEHIDQMLEEDMMDGRMVVIYKAMQNYPNLSDLEKTWLVTIGDFMLRNKKFNTAKDGDWYNTMLFVTTTIEVRMEEEEENLDGTTKEDN